MNRPIRLAVGAITALLLTVATTFAASPAQAAVWWSSDPWGTWSSDGYKLSNAVWGSGAGPQTIWANTPSNWGVWADHPNTWGVKSYANSGRWLGTQVSTMGPTTSSFDVTVPTSGVSFESTYDIYSSDEAYEIMLWMNKYGAVGPLGSLQTTTWVGGHTWDIYRGFNGSMQVFSFVRTSNISSGTVDIRAIAQWLRSQGWMGDVTMGNATFGFEISSSAGGKDFITNQFSVTG
jgi:hypothetical protein